MALLGNNNRKSVLEENSSLYQAEEEKTEKQKWATMDRNERLRYFLDYYLLKCIILFAVIIGISFFLWETMGPKKEREIFIAVVHDSLIPEGKAELEQDISELLITDENKQEIYLDDTLPNGYETEAKLSAYINAKEIDLVITNEDHFKEMAANGYFEDFNDFMPEFSKANESILCYAQGYTENSDTDNDTAFSSGMEAAGTDDARSEKLHAYGLRITDFDAFKNAWYSDSEAIIGVVRNSERKNNVQKILLELFSL